MFRTKLQSKKSYINRCADFLRNSFGTVWFLVLNALIFALWLILNSGWIPNSPIFDPYPYGFLTMAVSLEAIFLSVIVLISQNRANEIDELRDDLDLEINIKAESEITRIVNMLDEIHDHLGLPTKDDAELRGMKKKTNINDMQDELMRIEKN